MGFVSAQQIYCYDPCKFVRVFPYPISFCQVDFCTRRLLPTAFVTHGVCYPRRLLPTAFVTHGVCYQANGGRRGVKAMFQCLSSVVLKYERFGTLF